MAVAASLNGGNVLDFFVRSILTWVSALGLNITEGNLNIQLTTTNQHNLYMYIICNWISDELWNRLLHLPSEEHLTPLIVSPLMFGERHNPKTYGSLINITNDNFTLAELFSGFSKGLVKNLIK